MVAPDGYRYQDIEEHYAYMASILREWYHTLGPIKQVQLHQVENTDMVIVALHHEYLGDQTLILKEVRKEYFDMKCYSLKIPNIEHYYQRMAQEFYQLNDYNDLSLKKLMSVRFLKNSK